MEYTQVAKEVVSRCHCLCVNNKKELVVSFAVCFNRKCMIVSFDGLRGVCGE